MSTKPKQVMGRERADHARTAQECRNVPGEWIPVALYRSRHVAVAVAGSVRAGEIPSYAPAGAFDARWKITDFEYELLVRYVAVTSESAH